jgi:hypothetical protein
MNDWGILDDSSVSANGDVEYVGMADDDTPPVRVPRRPVRRASAASIPAYNRPRSSQTSIPAYNRPTRHPMHPMQPGQDDLYHLPTSTGAEVAMNAEAIQNMRTGGVHDIGGRTARRVQPGTYVTYGPGRGPSGHPGIGMGGNGMGDLDWIGDVVGGVAAATGAIFTGVTGLRGQRLEAELAAEQLRIEQEAEKEAREYAAQESERDFQLRMEEIRQQTQAQMAELQALRETGAQLDEARGQYGTTLPPVNGAAAGVSPVVWVLLAVVGIGGVGTVVWLLTKDKDEGK